MIRRALTTRTLLVVLATGLLGGFVVTTALQSDSPPTPPPGPDRPSEILGGWLRLSPEQRAAVTTADPDYAIDRAALAATLAHERAKLAELFEDPQTPDQAIRAQLERVIAAHDQLERRIVDYLLALRPHLTLEQKQKLFRTCARGIRDAGGPGWRHGGRGMGHGRGLGRGRGPGWGAGHRAGRPHHLEPPTTGDRRPPESP